MEPIHFFSPRSRLGLHPLGFSLRHAKGPVEEIAHVTHDFYGSSRSFSQLKGAEPRRRVALDLGGTICDSRQCVAKESALGILQCQSGSSVRVSTCTRAADALPESRCQPPPLLLCATAISKLSGANQRA